MAKIEDRWLSVDEIGKYLGVSSDTVYRWIDKHAMPAHRMGRLWKFKNNILAPVVQQVQGSLEARERGLIITTSDFSAGAIKEAVQSDKTPIALINDEQLVMLLMKNDIGVHRSTPDRSRTMRSL